MTVPMDHDNAAPTTNNAPSGAARSCANSVLTRMIIAAMPNNNPSARRPVSFSWRKIMLSNMVHIGMV